MNQFEQDLPEWMKVSEHYMPEKDRDTFLKKSILSLLSLFSKLRKQEKQQKEEILISPVLKVVVTIFLLLCVSVSKHLFSLCFLGMILMCYLCFFTGQQILSMIRFTLTASIFTAILLLPSFWGGNAANSIMLLSKVFLDLLLAGILSNSCSWNQITASMGWLHVPSLFILILDLTLKYIWILGEKSLYLLQSLCLRSVGKNKKKYLSLGGVAGTLFLKSREMSQEIYQAMVCRGFCGQYTTYPLKGKKRGNFLYLMYGIFCCTVLLL